MNVSYEKLLPLVNIYNGYLSFQTINWTILESKAGSEEEEMDSPVLSEKISTCVNLRYLLQS